MRLLRWEADHSVHPDPRQVRLGIVVLTALGASALLHRVDESSVSAVLSMVSKDRYVVVADPGGHVTTRIVYDLQVMAAQALIERAGRGLAVLDEEIVAVANATSIPGTQLFEAVVEDASV